MPASSPASFRTLLQPQLEYVDVNREERYYAALLFHMLLSRSGAERFLDLVRAPRQDRTYEPQVFFEYTHLRDRFSAAATACGLDDRLRSTLRDAIVHMLAPPLGLRAKLEEASPGEFNETFCAPGRASPNRFQMPSRWSPRHRFDSWHACDPDFAERACKMAWAFNAKPDLVIHTAPDAVVCVEVKVESNEGAYSVASKRLGGEYRARQLEIQRHALTDLLGYQAHFVFLSPNGKLGSQTAFRPECCVTWEQVIRALAADSASTASGVTASCYRALANPVLRPSAREPVFE
jgi:hypothetical protein